MFNFIHPSQIALKIIKLLIVFSSLITLITTGVQLWSEYGRDVDAINVHFDQVERGYLDSVAENVWQSDVGRLKLLMKGITASPDFKFAAVRKTSGLEIARAGQTVDENLIRNVYPLLYMYRGQSIEIGQLEVVASLTDVYKRTLDRFGLILLSNAIKTFVVAIFMFLVVHWLVTRHLDAMATFARKVDLSHPTEAIRLERGFMGGKRDEVDLLAASLNDMQYKLSQSHEKLEAALAREIEYNSLQKKFVSLVSHEFRTPLSIIDGTAQRLLRSKKPLTQDDMEARVEKVRSAVTRMTGLIDTTLYASRLDDGKIDLKIASCDIWELLREVCHRQSEIAPSHRIQITLDDRPTEVFADAKLIDQVFTNLLSNAVKYAPNAPIIEVRGWSDGADALITITDFGIGIPEEDLPHMFERFFRSKTTEGFSGTGIGLSVVKEFIQMHGGTVIVDSLEGEGATFTVRLPIGNAGR